MSGDINMLTDFKNKLMNLNDIIYFDENEFLREKPKDRVLLQRYIDEGEKLLGTTLNNEDVYFLKGLLGNLYRIIGESSKAIQHLRTCLQYAENHKDISKEVVSLIRLGEALKYNNNHRAALFHFNDALKKSHAEDVNAYIDFVLQHKGKCLLELSKFTEAEKCFMEALRLRRQKGDMNLFRSTERAIELLKELETTPTKRGENMSYDFLIREAVESDAEQILEHTRKVYKENPDVMATTIEEFTMTLEEEKRWINTQKQIGLLLVAEVDGRIVGMLNFQLSPRKRFSHTGMFGMSVQEQFSNIGIGGALLMHLLDWAKENKSVEKISLEVFSNNARAIHLYVKHGFVEEGRKKNQVKLGPEEYVDVILMSKMI